LLKDKFPVSNATARPPRSTSRALKRRSSMRVTCGDRNARSSGCRKTSGGESRQVSLSIEFLGSRGKSFSDSRKCVQTHWATRFGFPALHQRPLPFCQLTSDGTYRVHRCKVQSARCMGARCMGARCMGARCMGARCMGARCMGARCMGAKAHAGHACTLHSAPCTTR